MATKRAPLRTFSRSLSLIALSLGVAHCGGISAAGGEGHAAPPNESPAERQARAARYRAWEPAALSDHALTMADGAITAQAIAATTPKVDCKDVEGHQRCGIVVDLGRDPEGQPHAIECIVEIMPIPLPYGVMLHQALGNATLVQQPTAKIEWVGEGLLVTFAAELQVAQENNTLIGTGKLAVHYAPGRTTACFDGGAGGRVAFHDVTTKLFESMKGKADPDVIEESAYVTRRGDTPAGFQYYVVRKSDSGGFSELVNDFALATNEKSWHVSDRLVAVTRDAKGTVESFRSSHWREGAKEAVSLSAKPSEGGKYRLKLEYGAKSDALEITPKATISTEAWEASGLSRVASGAAPLHRYALLGVNEDGEPALSYSKLTRIRAGVIQEEIERPDQKKSATNAAEEKNELTVDARGQVSKQVSSDTISELIHSSGSPPALSLAKNASNGNKGATPLGATSGKH